MQCHLRTSAPYKGLDEEKTETWDPSFVHEHAFIFEVRDGLANRPNALREVHACLAKSQLVLDDGFELDSMNALLGASTFHEIGGPLILDSGGTLSNHVWKQERVEILERFRSDHRALHDVHVSVEAETAVSRCHDHLIPSRASHVSSLSRSLRGTIPVRTPGVVVWHDHRHREKKWSEGEVIISEQHRFINKLLVFMF